MKRFTNFNFHMYTDILFGKGTENQVAEKIRQHGGTKVMLVYGTGSVKQSGLYDTVVDALNKADISFVELGGVKPNPLRSLAQKGLELAQKENVDFMLGVGGGSTIDTAKAIALGLANDGDFWSFFAGKAIPKKMQKVGTIHTLSAAGSETSGSTVLVDDIDHTYKKALMYPDIIRPVFAIMNPELTYTVSPYQTAVGAADIMSHTFERYFIASNSYLCDQFAAGVMRSIVKYASIALEHPDDYEARAELMLAASFSHNGITGIGRSGESFTAHGLEAYLSGAYDTAHGAGLALVMPAWLQYIVQNGNDDQINRAAQFAAEVFDVAPDMQDAKATAYEGIRRFRAWNQSIGMPLTLADMNIPASDIPQIVSKTRCNEQGILKGYIDLDKNAVACIFTSLV